MDNSLIKHCITHFWCTIHLPICTGFLLFFLWIWLHKFQNREWWCWGHLFLKHFLHLFNWVCIEFVFLCFWFSLFCLESGSLCFCMLVFSNWAILLFACYVCVVVLPFCCSYSCCCYVCWHSGDRHKLWLLGMKASIPWGAWMACREKSHQLTGQWIRSAIQVWG